MDNGGPIGSKLLIDLHPVHRPGKGLSQEVRLTFRAVRSGVGAGLLGALLSPAALLGQAPRGEQEPTIQGELVRFADATVQVSIFASRVADLPEAIWARARSAGTAGILPKGPPSVNDEVRAHLESILGAAAVRTAREASELAPFGVEVGEEGGLRIVWYDLTEEEGVAILADARAADESFTLRILIPTPNVTEEDWWGLQAALSRVGIRRVQILGGGAP
jgi:hypothetical protein